MGSDIEGKPVLGAGHPIFSYLLLSCPYLVLEILKKHGKTTFPLGNVGKHDPFAAKTEVICSSIFGSQLPSPAVLVMKNMQKCWVSHGFSGIPLY